MISEIILCELMKTKNFARKVLPHLEESYFESQDKKQVFNEIKKYIVKYKNLPSTNSLKLEISKNEQLSESLYQDINQLIDKIKNVEDQYDLDWLVDNTEQWCKERALHNAILESVTIIEEKKSTGIIPELVRKALQVEFDTSIGIELMDKDGIDGRWEEYQKKDVKFPTNINAIDAVTSGGLEPKSLSCILAGTNAGKSSAMCALGANFLRNGNDVLYITLEMAEEKIAQRFDANFLNVDINDVPMLSEKKFKSTVLKLKEKTKGRLVVKEFPPASIGTNKIRSLLDELKIKKGFEPKIIIVDYINLMVSDRVKSDNSYQLIKSIAEELRGLAVEGKYAILTATQGNRETNDENNSDIDLTNTSESIGLPATVDLMLAAIMPTELREQGIQIWKVLKNRFGGIVNHKFPLRVNFARAGLSDMDVNNGVELQGNSEQNNIALQKEEVRKKRKNMIEVDIQEETDDLLSLIE